MATLTIPNWSNCKKIKSQFQVLFVKNVFIAISVGTPFCRETCIPNPPFPLLTTALFLRITAHRQNSVDWRIAFLSRSKRRQLKKFQVALRIGLAQNVGGVEKSGNKYAFFFLFRQMFYQHFKCIKNCLSSLIC